MRQITSLNKAYRAALNDADDIKLRWAKFGSVMSGLTSFTGSVFGIALSAMGLISVSQVDHPFVYRVGQVGIGVFVVLLFANLVLVCRTVSQAFKGRRPSFVV